MSEPGRDIRILVVEDDFMIAELIEMMLEPSGYQTRHACDGVAGLERLQEEPFDAVILDLNMPRLDGRGMLRAIRDMGGDLARIPIMVLSGRGHSDEVDEALSLGAKTFMPKPFDSGTLVAKVGRLIGG